MIIFHELISHTLGSNDVRYQQIPSALRKLTNSVLYMAGRDILMWTEILASCNYKESILQIYFTCHMLNPNKYIVHHLKTIPNPSLHRQLSLKLMCIFVVFLPYYFTDGYHPYLRKHSNLNIWKVEHVRLGMCFIFCISMKIPRFLFWMVSHVVSQCIPMWQDVTCERKYYVLSLDQFPKRDI